MNCTALFCTDHNCTADYCTALHYNVFTFTAFDFIASHRTAFHLIVLHCTVIWHSELNFGVVEGAKHHAINGFQPARSGTRKTSRDCKWLPRINLIGCWGVKLFLTKDFWQKLFFWFEFEFFFNFVITWVVKFCHNTSC